MHVETGSQHACVHVLASSPPNSSSAIGRDLLPFSHSAWRSLVPGKAPSCAPRLALRPGHRSAAFTSHASSGPLPVPVARRATTTSTTRQKVSDAQARAGGGPLPLTMIPDPHSTLTHKALRHPSGATRSCSSSPLPASIAYRICMQTRRTRPVTTTRKATKTTVPF